MGVPALNKAIEPSTLASESLTPAKLQAQLRRAARLKPRGRTSPTIPTARDDSLSEDLESYYVTRTASPRWKREAEAGIKKLAVDNLLLNKAAQEDPDGHVVVAPPLLPSVDGPEEKMMPLSELLRVAERVLERHSEELERPSPSLKVKPGVFFPNRGKFGVDRTSRALFDLTTMNRIHCRT
jgi:hypothetical protein